ncbi:MAG: hypothetical protein F7C35_02415 [Desulfurococcales archaeon]|nr:hypothetical protein [Desulfurococcales archaeon]
MARVMTVKDLLKNIKEYSSIAVDLSFYALISGDREAAVEVLKIENEIDRIFERLVEKISIAVRSPEDASIAVVVANIGRALDKVSDAAGDLAGLVLREYPVHDYVKAAINCCNEMVALLRAKKKVRDIPTVLDLLVVRRGDSYLLAPKFTNVEKGDILVVRGMPEEISELAGLVGDSQGVSRLTDTGLLMVAQAGDPLAEAVVKIKNLARSALDLALHSLVYGDPSLLGIVNDLEDEVDTLFHSILERSYAASSGNPREMVSIAIFASAMEQLADSAVQMGRTILREEYLQFVGEALEEAEEAYVKARVTERLAGKKISDLDLPEIGVNVIALGRRGSWIIPVLPDYTLEEDDVLLLKYFKPKGEATEERVESILERMGLEILED